MSYHSAKFPMPTEIKPGDVINVFGGEKIRRAVVVRILPDRDADAVVRILALWGTGTNRPDRASVIVEPRTSAGVVLRLEKTTFFYPGNVTICDESRAQRLGVRCPPELLLRLSALVGL